MLTEASASSLIAPQLENFSGALVYLVVWGIVVVSTGVLVAFFMPGSSLLFGSGLLAASAGSGVNVVVLTVGTFVSCVVGEQFGYWSGRRLGRPYLERRTGPTLQKQLQRTETFYDRYGAGAVVSARFIPWVRTFTPFIAGIGRMPQAKFVVANVVGAICWGVGITMSGYFAGSIPVVKTLSYAVGYFFITATLISLVVGFIRNRVKRARSIS